MARRYHQTAKDRRDESRGMKKAMHEEDRPDRHMGHGHFANMPPREIFHEYPKQTQNYGQYNDTIHGIDMVEEESYRKRDSHESHQK